MKVCAAILVFLVASVSICSGEWMGLWEHSSYYYGINEDGEVWKYSPVYNIGEVYYVGSFGAGEWMSFTASFSGPMYALNRSGEIWAMSFGGDPWLHAAMPSHTEWCSFMRGTGTSQGPGVVLACNGEVWQVSLPQQLIGTLSAGAIPTDESSWGGIKRSYSHGG